MKNIFKSAYLALPLVAAMAFTACDNNEYEYTPAPETGAQVYFSSELPQQYNITKESGQFTIDVMRSNTATAIDVPLEINIEEGAPFTCPTTSVHFEAGEPKAPLTFTYDPEALNYGDYYHISLAIADSALISTYGVGTYDFMAGVTAYRLMVDKDGKPALAKFRSDTWEGAYGVGSEEWEVEIEENVVEPGKYRLLAPYGEDGNPYGAYYVGDHTEYIEIDATDPDYVWIPGRHDLAMEISIGRMWIISFVQDYLNDGVALDVLKAEASDLFGTFKDGVITLPANSLILNGQYYAAANGKFRVILPGYAVADYSATIEYTGRYIDAKENGQVIANITLGADAAMAKVVLAAGNNPEVGYTMIENGEDGVVTVTGNGEVRLPYGAPGEYTICAVTYSKGEAKDKAYANILIQGGAEPDTYSAWYKGIYTHCVQPLTSDGEAVWDAEDYQHEDVILYACDQDETKYKLAPWIGAEMTFYMNDDLTVVVPENYTGYDHSTYGEIYGMDVKSYGAGNIDSYFDTDEGAFLFCLAWYVEAGYIDFTADTYTLTEDLASGEAAPARKVLRRDLKKVAPVHSLFDSVSKPARKLGGKLNKNLKPQNGPVKLSK